MSPGIATLTDQTWMPVMGRRPVGDLWGVGPRTVKKLDELVCRRSPSWRPRTFRRCNASRCGPPGGTPDRSPHIDRILADA
jgi:hypothetical protein